MNLIFYICFLIYAFIKDSICTDINIWKYTKDTLFTSYGTKYTGAVYIKDSNNFFISYIDSKLSFIKNIETRETIEINDKVCPSSLNKKFNEFYILFTGDNLMFSNKNGKFTKLDETIPKTSSLYGNIIDGLNLLLISFIGTDTMILYENKNNILKQKAILNINGSIIMSAFYRNFMGIDYIFLLEKNSTHYLQSNYFISDFNSNYLGSTNKFIINAKFNEITEMNHFIKDNEFYFLYFSYDKNENNFNFYLYQNIGIDIFNLKSSGNKYNFLPFRNAKIIQVFFLPETEYLFYLIQIGQKKYAGVLDIINRIIIFNFETTTEFISYEQFYLLYSENNSLLRVCPFNTNLVQNCIIYSEKIGTLIKINLSTNVNTVIYNKCYIDAAYMLDKKYCYDKCPLGYYKTSFNCLKCNIFDIDSQECEDECDDEDQIYDKLNGICYSCKPFKQFKNNQLNECVDDCSVYGLYNDENVYICKSCKEVGKYLQDNKCVDDCGPLHIKDEENKLCIKCEKETPYYQDNKCVKECSINYILNKNTNKCIFCKNYLQNGECVEKCNKYYKIDNINKICINCQKDLPNTPFYQNNECVSKCDNNYKIDEDEKICINCEKEQIGTPYLQSNECVSKCDENYKVDEMKKMCINCQEDTPKTPYLQNNECVIRCDNNYKSDNIKKICINCQMNSPKTPYLQDNQCVSKCSDYYVQNETSMRCFNCSKEFGNEYYFFNGTCVKECSNYYFKDEINKRCYKCKDINIKQSYYEEGKCLANCSKYLVIDEKNLICLNCSKTNNEYFQDNKCVKECSPGYSSFSGIKACYKCKDYGKYEYKGDCLTKCPEYTVNNLQTNQCQLCRQINSSTPFFDITDEKCVSDCKIGFEKDTINYICQKCLKFYNNATKKCIDKCPKNTGISGNICQKCSIYDKSKNVCVSECSKGKYPFNIKEEDYTICYEGFCGYGICSPNDNNNKTTTSSININNLYNCEYQNNENNFIVFGKYLQYKYLKKSNEGIKIKPLQDIIYINKKNIFTFELIGNKFNNSLPNLLNAHELNKNRRIKYLINWNLVQNNITQSKKKEIGSNELFFVVEPNTFIDDSDNIIKLTISDRNRKILYNTELYIKTKLMKNDSFDIVISSLNERNKLFSVKLDEKNVILENYLYKYIYITDDGEEFSLTNYIRNNEETQTLFIPFCKSIKSRIKNDFGNIIDVLSTSSLNFIPNKNKNLTIILKNNNNISDWTLLTELKSFLAENQNYNISNEKEILNQFISLIKTKLVSTIIYENKMLNNYYGIEETDEIMESNVLISLINQLVLINFKNNINNNCDLYLKVTDIINSSLNNNSSNIEFLSEKTILSFLRTIDNLLSALFLCNCSKSDYSILYENIKLIKYIISKNAISGSRVKIDGKNFDIFLFKPGYNTENFCILNIRKRDENTRSDFMEYKDYKFDFEKINNAKCDDDLIFSFSKINYDYFYDEITYLKNEEIKNLIISITRFNNPNNFISKLNKIVKNLYLNDEKNSMPKQISDYSFLIEITEPLNRKIFKNLKQFKYYLSFDLKKTYENNKSDIICVALNSIKLKNNNIEVSKEGACITYFDSKKHKIICECNTDGEISILLDKKLSILIKNSQSQKHEYKIINSLSGSIILCSLALISFLSIMFIIYDFYDDEENNYIQLMNVNIRAQYEYENFKNLKNSSIIKFALYLIYYKYSFFNIIIIYKYNHPRYIRFIIEIIKILLNLLASIFPFYYLPFHKKEDKYYEFKEQEGKLNYLYFSNNDFNFIDTSFSFLYSLMASIFIFFIAHIIYKLFEHKTIRKLIWKVKKNVLKECVHIIFKKDFVFNKKMKLIQKRILAYTKLCGKYILENKKKDKLSNYLEYKKFQQIPKKNMFENMKFLLLKNKTINSEKHLDFLKEKLLDSNSNEINTNSQRKYSIDSKSKKIKSKNLTICNAVQPFTLTKKSSNINISMTNVYKYEYIRNKYIFINNQNNGYNKEYNPRTIKYINLYIETQKNYSYLFSNDISINHLITAYNKSKLMAIIIINISLLVTLLIIDIIIIIVLNKMYEEFDNYIIINWLIPSLFQMLIINFIINYLFALFSSFLLYSYYDKRNNNCFYKVIFNIFVEKYMRYLYKIRLLINKYYREFENLK